MAMHPAKTQSSLGIHPVWSESLLCAQCVAKDPSFPHADREDSDQTGQMPRLIWVFAGRTAILLVLSCRGSFKHRSTIWNWNLQNSKSFAAAAYNLLVKLTFFSILLHKSNNICNSLAKYTVHICLYCYRSYYSHVTEGWKMSKFPREWRLLQRTFKFCKSQFQIVLFHLHKFCIFWNTLSARNKTDMNFRCHCNLDFSTHCKCFSMTYTFCRDTSLLLRQCTCQCFPLVWGWGWGSGVGLPV